MKKLISIPVMLLFSGFMLSLHAQNVPQQVKDKFAQDHPGATNVQWEMEGAKFEAEFESEGVEREVVYDAAGNVLATEEAIDATMLPQAVFAAIQARYGDHALTEAEKVVSGSKVFYEVELKKGEDEVELLFDGEGNLVESDGEAEEGHED